MIKSTNEAVSENENHESNNNDDFSESTYDKSNNNDDFSKSTYAKSVHSDASKRTSKTSNVTNQNNEFPEVESLYGSENNNQGEVTIENLEFLSGTLRKSEDLNNRKRKANNQHEETPVSKRIKPTKGKRKRQDQSTGSNKKNKHRR